MVALAERTKDFSDVAVVIGSKDGSPALERAAELGLRCAVVEPGEGYGQRLVAALAGCDLVCLAGYMRLLPTEVLAAFPDRILNIHPALLPKFGGKGMYGHHVHEAVIAAGETESGCTVHLVNEHYDEGRILLQEKCPVLPDDTPETLAARVLECEHRAYARAVEMVSAKCEVRSAGEQEPQPDAKCEVPGASEPEPSARCEVRSATQEPNNSELGAETPDPALAPRTSHLAPSTSPRPSSEPDLQHPFFQHVVLPMMRVVAWILFTLLGPFRIRNRRAIPKTGGLLILANHLADVDPVVVQLSCPRPIYFISKSELAEMRGVRYFLRLFRSFPVKRGEPDRSAIKKAVALVQAGHVVCIYPEGELSESGKLQELKGGAALIVRLARAPVICCGIRNTNRIMPYGSMIPRPAFAWVSCNWGEAREFDRKAENEEIIAWAAAELRRLIGEA